MIARYARDRMVQGKAKDAKFDVARIDESEREVKRDVITFLIHLSEIVGAARALSIIMHDHFVIGRGGHASFKALGLL